MYYSVTNVEGNIYNKLKKIKLMDIYVLIDFTTNLFPLFYRFFDCLNRIENYLEKTFDKVIKYVRFYGLKSIENTK